MANTLFKHVIGDKKKPNDVNAYDDKGNVISGTNAEWKTSKAADTITTYQQFATRAEEIESEGAQNLKSIDVVTENGIRIPERTMLSEDRQTGKITGNPIYFDMNDRFTSSTLLADGMMEMNTSLPDEKDPNYPRHLNIQEPWTTLTLTPLTEFPFFPAGEFSGLKGTDTNLENIPTEKQEIDDLIKLISTKQVGFSNATVGFYGKEIDGMYTLDRDALNDKFANLKFPNFKVTPATESTPEKVTLTIRANLDTKIPVIFTPKDINKYNITKMNAHLHVIDNRTESKEFTLGIAGASDGVEVECNGCKVQVPANIAVESLLSTFCTSAKGCNGIMDLELPEAATAKNSIKVIDAEGNDVTGKCTITVDKTNIPGDAVCASARRLITTNVRICPTDETLKKEYLCKTLRALVAIVSDDRGVNVSYRLKDPATPIEITLTKDNAPKSLKGAPLEVRIPELSNGEPDSTPMPMGISLFSLPNNSLITSDELLGKLTFTPEGFTSAGTGSNAILHVEPNSTGSKEGLLKAFVVSGNKTNFADKDIFVPVKITDNRPEQKTSLALKADSANITLTALNSPNSLKGSPIVIVPSELTATNNGTPDMVGSDKKIIAFTNLSTDPSSDPKTIDINSVQVVNPIELSADTAELNVDIKAEKSASADWLIGSPMRGKINVTITDNRPAEQSITGTLTATAECSISGKSYGDKGKAGCIPMSDCQVIGGQGEPSAPVKVTVSPSVVPSSITLDTSSLKVSSDISIKDGGTEGTCKISARAKEWNVKPLICDATVSITDNRFAEKKLMI